MTSLKAGRPGCRPRILLTTGGHVVYGKERVVLALARGLAARGYRLYGLTNAWGNGEYPRALAEVGVSSLPVYLGWIYLSQPAWTLDSARNAPRAFAETLRLYRRFRPDLVLHDSIRTLVQLGWRTPGRNVLGVHDYHSGLKNQILFRSLDWQVRTYVAVSEDVRKNLLSFGVPDAKIRVIGNPADFGPTIRRPTVVRDDVPTVGIVGQVTEQKGHHVVIEAMAALRRDRPDLRFRLRVFGDGPADHLRRLKAQAEDRGVADRIEWCGYKPCHDDIYPSFDFGLVPSLVRETFGMVAVEPAVYGRPVIASAIGGLSYIVRDGITGYLVPPNDPAALADRMARLLADPAHAQALGEAAFADYKARFDAPRFVEQYARVLGDATLPRQ